MTEPSTTPAQPLPSPPADRTALDPPKRRKILALLSLGSSRRAAARFVGCAPSTITRTAQRDPQFADELARAEMDLELESLRTIRRAAKTKRYWRAAAWVLERKNPHEFGHRSAGGFNAADVFEILAEVLASLGARIADDDRRCAMEHLGALICELDPQPLPLPNDQPHPIPPETDPCPVRNTQRSTKTRSPA